MRRTLIALITIGILLFIGGAPNAGAVKRGGTLKIAMAGNPPHLDGTTALGFPIKFLRETMGAGLLLLDENFNITGDLARKWEVSDNGRVITFHLYPGAKFHDGTPMDAAAVKWNLDLIGGRLDPTWVKAKKKQNPKFKFRSSYRLYLHQIKKVEVLDKNTVRIYQDDIGKAQTLAALAGYYTRFVLVSPKSYDKDNQKFRKKPVYGGPFKIVDYKPKRFVIMERFKNYFRKGLPYLDRIEVYYMPNATQRLNAIRAGEIDVILNAPLGIVTTLKKDKRVVLHTSKASTTYVASINNSRPMWKDIRVRKALGCYGINRSLIVRTALRGLSVPWNSFSAPGAKDAIDLTAMCPYDLERAKKLLAEAGYGPSNPLKFTMLISNTDPTYVEISQIMQFTYSKLGVQMKTQIVDFATWLRTWGRKRNQDMTLQNTIPTYDVNSNSHTFYSKTALDYYETNDPKLDGLLEKWRSTIDPRKQIEISHRLQRYMAEMGYYPAFSGSPFFQATRSYVKGWKFMDKLVFNLRGVWLDK